MSVRRLVVIVFSILGVLVLALVLYLAFGDLSRHKGRIEAFVTKKTGRPFAIDGAFKLEVLPSVSVAAERVRLGNAEWGSAPQMVEVGRFSTEIGLWSLVSGPADVRSLELGDVSVLLEKGKDGKGNWVLGEGTEPAAGQGDADSLDEGATEVPAVIRKGTLSNVRVTYRTPGKPDRVALLETLTIAPGTADLLAISGKGRVGRYATTLTGELGPLDALFSGRDIRMALEAGVENLRLDVKGGLGRLNPLDGADLTLKVEHPDVGTMLENLRLPVVATGGLTVDARLKDKGELTQVDVDAKLGDIDGERERHAPDTRPARVGPALLGLGRGRGPSRVGLRGDRPAERGPRGRRARRVLAPGDQARRDRARSSPERRQRPTAASARVGTGAPPSSSRSPP